MAIISTQAFTTHPMTLDFLLFIFLDRVLIFLESHRTAFNIHSWFDLLDIVQILSPRNALRWGYSNAAVVPSVRPSVVPSVCRPCEHDRDYTVAYLLVKLGSNVNHDKRMNPIDFGGQRSKVKVTMDLYGNKLVNTIDTTPLHIYLSNLADVNHD